MHMQKSKAPEFWLFDMACHLLSTLDTAHLPSEREDISPSDPSRLLGTVPSVPFALCTRHALSIAQPSNVMHSQLLSHLLSAQSTTHSQLKLHAEP